MKDGQHIPHNKHSKGGIGAQIHISTHGTYKAIRGWLSVPFACGDPTPYTHMGMSSLECNIFDSTTKVIEGIHIMVEALL